MQQARLVSSEHDGSHQVFFANASHPDADALRTLVASETRRSSPTSPEDELVKRQLKAMGAPLRGVGPEELPESKPELFVHAMDLARRDPVVAKTLPVCIWKQRDSITAKALEDLSARPEDKHALGFFLELTSELGGDRRLAGLAAVLHDRRFTAVREFFYLASTRREAQRDFSLATKWGFRMSMNLEAFRALFDKFVATP